MKRFLIAALALTAGFSARADVKGDVGKIDDANAACMAKAQSNMDMKECQGNAMEAMDKLLNQNYGQIVAKLKTAIAEEKKSGGPPLPNGKGYGEETLARLVASERAWVAYRDAECSFQGTEMLGGTGESLVWAGCETDLTEKKILDLDQVLNGTN